MFAFALAGGLSSVSAQTPGATTTAAVGTTTAAAGTPTVAAATTPAAAGTPITAATSPTATGAQLPSTGTGPGAGGNGVMWLVVGGVALALLGGGVVWSGTRRNRRT